MDKALADFAQAPLSYDLHDLMSDEEIEEMAHQVAALRKELYESAGRNRSYHVKAEDMKNLLPDWAGADGCIATNRITVEAARLATATGRSRMATGTAAGASPPVTRAMITWTTPTTPGFTS